MLFVELTQSFERIPRKWLFDSIRSCFPEGESVRLFDILEKFYQKISLTYQKAQITFLVASGVLKAHALKAHACAVCILASMYDDSIRIFKHQYRINATSIREQRLRMHNENIKLWGSCGRSDFIHARYSFTAKSYNHC